MSSKSTINLYAITCSLVSSLLTMIDYSIVLAITRSCLILKTGYSVSGDFSMDSRFNLIIDNVSVTIIVGLAYIVGKSIVVDVCYACFSIVTKLWMDQQRNLVIHDWPKMVVHQFYSWNVYFLASRDKMSFIEVKVSQELHIRWNLLVEPW